MLSGTTVRADSAQSHTDVTERSRRQIVALVLVFYLLLIFEGALRKWVLTSYGQLLFFIRDPVVLLIYWLALRRSFFPRGSIMLGTGVVLGVVGLLVAATQAVGVAAGIDKWPLLAAYGWRNYFLYIPLPFVIAQVMEQRDLQRIAKLTFLLAVPIAMLVVLQFRSPLDSPINVGFGATLAEQFHGLAVDQFHTRPMGTFTSDVGQTHFTVSGFAFLIALWVAPAARRYLKLWQLVIATCALLTCLALSNSRGAMVTTGIVLITAVVSGAIVGKSGSAARAILIPLTLAVGAAVLYPIVFPEGYATFTNRWLQAQAVESQQFSGGIFGRAFYPFYDFFSLMSSTPLTGYGLGLAGNASLTLGVTIPGFTGWAESDWARHIVDLGPIVGVVFIFYRIALFGWLAKCCLAGARAGGLQLPLLLFIFCGTDLLYGQLTGHGTVNGYAWLFAGFALAAANAQGRVVESVAEPSDAAAAQAFPNLMR